MLLCLRARASSSGLGAGGRESRVTRRSARHLGEKWPCWICLGRAREQLPARSALHVEAMSLCRYMIARREAAMEVCVSWGFAHRSSSSGSR